MMQNKTSDRLGFLDGIRGFACLYVVIGHIFLAFNFTNFDALKAAFPKVSFIYTQLYFLVFRFGHDAVVVFLVLSGYCLILPIARKAHPNLKIDSVDFIRRRAKRILIPYYCALLISPCLAALFPIIRSVTHTYADANLPLTGLLNWASHILLLQNWTPYDKGINGVAWSMAVEWQTYFLLPLLFLPILRRVSLFAFLIITMVLGVTLYNLLHPFFPNASVQFASYFAIGCAAGFLSNHAPSGNLLLRVTKPLKMVFLLLSILIPILLLIQYVKSLHHITILGWISNHLTGDVWIEYLSAIWAGALLVALTAGADAPTQARGGGFSIFPVLGRIFSNKTLILVGGFSYSLYLVHPYAIIITDITSRHFLNLSPLPHLFWLFGVGIALSIIAGLVFFRFFERPCLNRPAPTAPAVQQPKEVIREVSI